MPDLASAIFETCMIFALIRLSFDRNNNSENPENWTKFLTGFRKFGSLNSGISKYGHLKNVFFHL